jgi:hypothetical protein
VLAGLEGEDSPTLWLMIIAFLVMIIEIYAASKGSSRPSFAPTGNF